ncbi:hypothetical protein [Streptomyces sp. NPDC088180]
MSATDREAMVRYDQLATRVYEERRMPAGTRDLVLGPLPSLKQASWF